MNFENFLKNPGHFSFSGVPSGYEAFVLLDLYRSFPERPLVHIVQDDQALSALFEMLRFFAPDVKVLSFPGWDCLPYDRVSPSAHRVSERIKTISQLFFSQKKQDHQIVLTTVSSVLQRIPPLDFLAQRTFFLKPGQKVSMEEVGAFLQSGGYTRTSTVLDWGEYALRGGVLDVFPPGTSLPVRLDFFGDLLESLRSFDPKTQRSKAQLLEVRIEAASEVILTPETLSCFRKGYASLCSSVISSDPLYEAVSVGRKTAGMEHWLPLFYEKMFSFLSLLPQAVITYDTGVENAFVSRWAEIHDYYTARQEALKQTVFGSLPYNPVPPQALYVLQEEWEESLKGHSVIFFSAFEAASFPSRTSVLLQGKPGKNFVAERQQTLSSLQKKTSEGYDVLYASVTSHIDCLRSQGIRVVLCASSEGACDRLEILLKDHGLSPLARAQDWETVLSWPKNVVALLVLSLEKGFTTPDFAFISEQDIFGEKLSRQTRRSRKASRVIAELATLSVGDCVVHRDHGIGRFEGLCVIEVQGAPHECLHLGYAGGDRLFVPVENSDLLTRFGSEDAFVVLDKLGGTSWSSRKEKLKKDLFEMAATLMETAAKRALVKGERVVVQDLGYEAFCARFPYDETEDQKQAIEDVLEDLASGHPMDRLVCGDVGFGKTEVALRSAFCVAMTGRQVAVVVPTTLLARQHFANFSKRFDGFPLRVALLSRLVGRKEAKATLEELATGRVDVVIGTHALLAKEVKFSDLGLLIIDEEQHFGVKHKERLKTLKDNVHVLTLTATPIPRTLQLSLSGVRELSLITTPPVDRLAVKTFVSPFDPVVIREYLLREYFRGGQSFFVVPRISDIEEIETFLKSYVPEVKVGIAHGRLSATALDAVMTDFYDRKYNVLIATTIIESGLDIATANTLIVHKADRFGLAQLYQIRGRIGRSKQRAYALLTTPEGGYVLNPVAQKRLDVLQSLDTLGAGFTLASHDLDLRGAGNLLGDSQSGHIKEVGFELYQTMLEEAIAELKAQKAGIEKPQETQWSVQLNLGIPVLIPETYVPDLELRLALYRRLAESQEEADVHRFAIELRDRFGPLPKEIQYLLAIVILKTLCRKSNIESVDAGPKGLVIGFREGYFHNPQALLEWVAQKRQSAKIRPDMKIVLQEVWSKPEARLKGVTQLVREVVGLLPS